MDGAIKGAHCMPRNKLRKIPLHYSRKKNLVEINGDPDDVKKLAWFDIVFSKALLLVIAIMPLVTLPKGNIVLLLWRIIRRMLFTILLPGVVECFLRLSG